jgi:bacteriocin-like protein
MEKPKAKEVKDPKKKEELSEEDLKNVSGGVKDESVEPFLKAPLKQA